MERALKGHLKGRLRRLRDVLLHNHEDICQLIMACCFLLNICVLNEDEIEEYSEEDDVDPNHFQMCTKRRCWHPLQLVNVP